MKYLIIALSLFSASAFAWNQQIYTPPGVKDSYDGGKAWRRAVAESNRPRTTHSMPNVFGGEDYYGNRGYMGRSIPNVHGGRDFYSNY